MINAGNKNIACEISVTTNVDHELGNIQKCLNAGYETTWIISDKNEYLESIKASTQSKFGDQELGVIEFFSIDDALTNIQSIKPSGSRNIRGRHVNLSWKEISPNEIKRRQTTFAKFHSQS